MANLSKKQQQILDVLLDEGEGMTLDRLAAAIGVTKTAAKEHVLKLLDQGFLGYTDQTGQVGRPRRHYHLTDSGREVFPRQYSWLSTTLLEVVAQSFGSAEISHLLKQMAADVAASMQERLARRATPPKRFAEITSIMNELGYRATLKQSDVRKDVVIEATNCVYHTVAKKHPQLCQFDIHLLEKMGQAKVRLESCIARGGTVCRFCMKKKPS